MTRDERLAKVERFLRDEIQLSWDMSEHFRAKGDKERASMWAERHDTLYSVLLRIVD